MEKILAKGVYAEKPSEKAPDFVKAKLSFKVAEAMTFFAEHVNQAGYVNIDLLESREGKFYCALNDFKPEKPASLVADASVEDPESEIPF